MREIAEDCACIFAGSGAPGKTASTSRQLGISKFNAGRRPAHPRASTYVRPLAIGVVATPLRRSRARPWLCAGAALALAIALPNVLAQAQHGGRGLRRLRGLPPDERVRAVFFAPNYGEAAALDIYGPALGGPPAISAHNSYFRWGPLGASGEVVITLGRDAARFGPSMATFARSATPTALMRCPTRTA